MKTVYVIVHDTTCTRNSGTAKIAFERKEDAEFMLGVFNEACRSELKIVEVPLQPPSAKPPAMRGGEPGGIGIIDPRWGFAPRSGGNVDGTLFSDDEPRVGNTGGVALP